ncbi:hypothetical protein FAZ78_19225 [Cereibacter changlensis]|uniref:Uncharacterized protein n=1 Tax=Cereibacter changlensis TaxID=402884 RepID=A0A4U0YR71_9RHOB|nr:hypothetical protein [Cereibacter changlensis]TKA94992.1 hypothetical protein FAZ78_19225 [Cereibacter changlensis]
MIPFQSIYPSSLGYVMRQTSSLTRHEAFGLTWIVGRGARCEIWLPLNTFSADTPGELANHLAKYEHVDRFIGMLEGAKASNSRVIDLNQMMLIVKAVANGFLKLIDRAGFNANAIHAKVILGSVWRVTPFVDSKIMLDRSEKYGLPLCLSEEVMMPSGDDADSFHEISLSKFPDVGPSYHSCAFLIFELVCRGLGLQGMITGGSAEEAAKLYDELKDAWLRASEE